MLQFFKSQKNGNGAAAKVSFNSKDQSFYIEVIKQTGYDASKNVGSFKGGAKINTKLSLFEVGGLLNAIYNRTEYKTVHKTADRTLNIFFAPYYIEDKASKENVYRGFGLTLMAAKDNVVKIGFAPNELEIVVEFLKFGLERCFSSLYADDKKRRDDAFKAKSAKEGGSKVKGESVASEYLPDAQEDGGDSSVVQESSGVDVDF